MKQFRRILGLTGIAAGIIIFWVAPGMNKAKSSEYTRVFEDTYARAAVVEEKDTTKLKLPVTEKTLAAKPEKKYLTETIDAEAGLKDLELEMFSRAIHFHEHEAIEEIFAIEDSLSIIGTVRLDSMQLADADTAKLNY